MSKTEQTSAQENPYGELMKRLTKRLDELDEAVETMKRAAAADQIAQGSLKSVEKTLAEMRQDLPAGDAVAATRALSALDKIATAVEAQAEMATRAEEKADAKKRKPRPEVVAAVKWIIEATGYRPEAGGRPDTIFWIEPRSAALAQTVSLYTTGDISRVVEIRVGGVTVETVASGDHLEFAVPRRLPGDVIRRRVARVEVDVKGARGKTRRTAWKTELDLKVKPRKAVT
jgi:hypothetical protein